MFLPFLEFILVLEQCRGHPTLLPIDEISPDAFLGREGP